MAESQATLRSGESHPFYAGADAPFGSTLTISGTPTYELIGPDGTVAASGNVSGSTAGAAASVEVYRVIDATSLDAGVYTLLFAFTAVGSDAVSRTYRPSIRIEVLAEAPAADDADAYATLPDVQARIPQSLWTGSPDSEPKASDVQGWLTQVTGWIDSSLRWKYTVPITDAGDLATLRPICADLVAARVWGVIAGHSEEYAKVGRELTKFAREMLAYDSRTGRSLLVLPSTAESDSGEAAIGQPEATFTDPDDCESEPRFFTIGMDF